MRDLQHALALLSRKVLLAKDPPPVEGDTAIDPKVAPPMAFKTVALKNLLTHHPELETFLKPLVECFGSSLARVFSEQLKSIKINTQNLKTMFRCR